MGTSRQFAYNPSLIAPSGATQFGNLAVSDTGWSPSSGGLRWFNGPNEDNRHIIGYPANGPKNIAGGGVVAGMSVGFMGTVNKVDNEFINLVNTLTGQNFATASTAKTWLNANGYWTSYTNPVVSNDLTLKLDAADPFSYPGTGTTWYDLATPQQNVTLINNPTWTSGVPSYFTFNGSNQRGSGSGGTGVVPQTQYTKSMWFYMNAYADNNIMSSDVGGHFMYFASTNRLYSGHSNWGNYAAYPSTATFNLNTWYYAALTFNTTDGMKLYINGSLDSTYTANKSAHTGDGSINIASFGGGNLLNGRVGKVYCYSRTLTASEVLQNYNADKAHFGY
jgi:hypothetical protein